MHGRATRSGAGSRSSKVFPRSKSCDPVRVSGRRVSAGRHCSENDEMIPKNEIQLSREIARCAGFPDNSVILPFGEMIRPSVSGKETGKGECHRAPIERFIPVTDSCGRDVFSKGRHCAPAGDRGPSLLSGRRPAGPVVSASSRGGVGKVRSESVCPAFRFVGEKAKTDRSCNFSFVRSL